jgi:amino-acid N-acetyltransferase
MTAPVKPEDFVRWLRQTAPYLHAFGGRSFVIGFGGELIAERARFAQFIQDVNLLAALDIRLVLVHGARPQIEAEMKVKGLRSRYAKGLRVTDAAALVAVKHAAGALRVEIEALLSQGLPSSPMAGAEIRVASGNYIAAQPIGVVEGVDYQFTGLVRKVDATAIARRLEAGEVVLVSHIGYSPTGEVFNLSWEDVAQNVAAALGADKLLLFVDRLPADPKGTVIGELTAREAEALLKRKNDLGAQAAGALRHALAALGAGVSRAHLIPRRTAGATLLELFTHSGVGTMITAEPMQRLREARIEDVGGILGLIEPLEADGTLVKRGRERLEREIANFIVLEHDGALLGCAALYPLPEKSAELACLAVAPEARDAGHGERLLQACQVRARTLKVRRLFALTTRAAHWFLERGFKAADPSALPGERQALYNWTRGSKVVLTRI